MILVKKRGESNTAPGIGASRQPMGKQFRGHLLQLDVLCRLELAGWLKDQGLHLRVLNLGGEAVNTSAPMGELLFTVLVALAQLERDVKLERSRDSVARRRAAGRNLGGRRQQLTERQIERARKAIAAGESPTDVAANLGMSRATLYRRLRIATEGI